MVRLWDLPGQDRAPTAHRGYPVMMRSFCQSAAQPANVAMGAVPVARGSIRQGVETRRWQLSWIGPSPIVMERVDAISRAAMARERPRDLPSKGTDRWTLTAVSPKPLCAVLLDLVFAFG